MTVVPHENGAAPVVGARLQALLESVVENANDVVLVTQAEPLDRERGGPMVIYVNPAFTRMTGYEPHEILGLTPRVLQSPNTDRAELARLGRALRAWEPVEVELLNRHKDGTEFWAQINITPVADERGWFTHWVSIQRDITPRKQRELALQALMTSATVVVLALDAKHAVVSAGDGLQATLGLEPDDVMGRPLARLVHPDEQSALSALLQSPDAFSLDAAGAELRLRHRDGTWRWMQIDTTDHRWEMSTTSRSSMMIVLTDITERKRAEEAVRHLSAIVQSSSDAIIGAATDGTILSWNNAAERLFGFAATEVMGRHTRILAGSPAAEQEMATHQRRLALGERIQNVETVRRHSDGSLLDVSITLSPVYDDDGSTSGFSAIIRDDSARKQVERALKQQADLMVSRLAQEAEASERLRELDQMKDALVATVSHELRTPLSSILGYIELLRDEEGGPLTGQQRQWADAMDRNGLRLLALVEDLLITSAIDAGNLQSGSSPVDLRQVVSNARGALQPKIEESRLSIHFNLPAFPVMVQGDVGQLEQVVCNLVGNALKFTEDGGVVECAVDVEGLRARLTVSDDGIGIPESEQPGLFTPFFRSTTASDHEIPGTGLGLSIASSIVGNHGGDIAVVSAPGRGTRVTVELPMSRPRAARKFGQSEPDGGRSRPSDEGMFNSESASGPESTDVVGRHRVRPS